MECVGHPAIKWCHLCNGDLPTAACGLLGSAYCSVGIASKAKLIFDRHLVRDSAHDGRLLRRNCGCHASRGQNDVAGVSSLHFP